MMHNSGGTTVTIDHGQIFHLSDIKNEKKKEKSKTEQKMLIS